MEKGIRKVYTILLVDDESTTIKLMRYMLESSKLPVQRIFEASDGKEALGIMREYGADLIITDVSMPYMTGLELCRQLSGEFKYTPSIIVSEHDKFDYVREALLCGVKDYLLKPLSKDRFLCSVRRTLEELPETVHSIGETSDRWRGLADSWVEAVLQDNRPAQETAGRKWLASLHAVPPYLCVKWHSAFHRILLQSAGAKLEREVECPLQPYRGQTGADLANWITADFKAMQHAVKLAAYTDNQRMIYNAQKYIQQHYNKEITLEELASSVGYSAPYFSYLFKLKTGISYMAYRTQLRLKRAQELLLKSDKPMPQIASEVGYNDVTSLIRAFKKELGYTPSDYRKGGLV
ncbi:two component transcriptional regulator, AraC family [Paenibacillus sp. UNC499MF]|nr:two component transcriptional regulator, AraC family [Paenibacillus sp. UNC499MF]